MVRIRETYKEADAFTPRTSSRAQSMASLPSASRRQENPREGGPASIRARSLALGGANVPRSNHSSKVFV